MNGKNIVSAVVRRKKIRKIAGLYWGGVLFLMSALFSFGATRVAGADYSPDHIVKNPSTLGTFQDLLGSIITYLNAIADPLVVIMFLWGGFQILTAGGDESKIKNGKKTITYAVIGSAIIICASGLIYIINQLLGVQTP